MQGEDVPVLVGSSSTQYRPAYPTCLPGAPWYLSPCATQQGDRDSDKMCDSASSSVSFVVLTDNDNLCASCLLASTRPGPGRVGGRDRLPTHVCSRDGFGTDGTGTGTLPLFDHEAVRVVRVVVRGIVMRGCGCRRIWLRRCPAACFRYVVWC